MPLKNIETLLPPNSVSSPMEEILVKRYNAMVDRLDKELNSVLRTASNRPRALETLKVRIEEHKERVNRLYDELRRLHIELVEFTRTAPGPPEDLLTQYHAFRTEEHDALVDEYNGLKATFDEVEAVLASV